MLGGRFRRECPPPSSTPYYYSYQNAQKKKNPHGNLLLQEKETQQRPDLLSCLKQLASQTKYFKITVLGIRQQAALVSDP